MFINSYSFKIHKEVGPTYAKMFSKHFFQFSVLTLGMLQMLYSFNTAFVLMQISQSVVLQCSVTIKSFLHLALNTQHSLSPFLFKKKTCLVTLSLTLINKITQNTRPMYVHGTQTHKTKVSDTIDGRQNCTVPPGHLPPSGIRVCWGMSPCHCS